MDRLFTLVESHYREISVRVRALETRDIQQQVSESFYEEDTASIENVTGCSSSTDAPIDIAGGAKTFDFTRDLQKSRVYRRTQAFGRSLISSLTGSSCSIGWSFFSDLSMAEISNISVLNLAITEVEVFNPQRSSQTWPRKASAHIEDNDDKEDASVSTIWYCRHCIKYIYGNETTLNQREYLSHLSRV